MAHSSRVAGQGWQQEREVVSHVASTIKQREVNAGLGSLSPFHSVCDPSLVDGAAFIQGGSPLLSGKPFLAVPSQTHLEECLLDDSRSCQVGSAQLAITDTPESR